MVSKIRYNALPKLRKKDIKQKVYLFGILIVALILAIVTNGEILFYIFIGIVLFGIFRKIYFLALSKKDENGNGSTLTEN